MQKQITLDSKIADEEKIWKFIERAFMRKAGLTKDNECEKCSIVPQINCPIYEDCDGWTDNGGVIIEKRIGLMEIAAPRVYFRGTLEEAYANQISMVDYITGD